MRWLSMTTKISAIVRNSEEMVQKIWVRAAEYSCFLAIPNLSLKKAYFFNCLVLLTENWYYQFGMGHFLPSGPI